MADVPFGLQSQRYVPLRFIDRERNIAIAILSHELQRLHVQALTLSARNGFPTSKRSVRWGPARPYKRCSDFKELQARATLNMLCTNYRPIV
jgi:hypothetical protein